MIKAKYIAKTNLQAQKTGREKFYTYLWLGLPLLLLLAFMANYTFSTNTYITRARRALSAGDTVLGFELYMTAVNRGDMRAMSGVIAARRHWNPAQYQRFIALVERKAGVGEPVFQNVLGEMYANGYGVRQDFNTGVEWLRKAAEKGNENALYNMGVCYLNGYGVFVDQKEAARWFEKAQKAGNPLAADRLAEIRALQARAQAESLPVKTAASKYEKPSGKKQNKKI